MPDFGGPYYETFSDASTFFPRTQTLFKRLVNNLSNHSELYAKSYNPRGECYFPLRERERNMYSALACAIDRVTRVHLSEIPFQRSSGGTVTQGRADIWCRYRKCQYLIELKRTVIAVNPRAEQSENIEKAWSKLGRQLDDLEKAFHDSLPDDEHAVRLGLLVIQARTWVLKNVGWSHDRSNEIRDHIKSVLGDSCSFIAVIEIPESWRVYRRPKGRTWFNPTIVIAGTYRTPRPTLGRRSKSQR
jgi:hypothetical protein